MSKVFSISLTTILMLVSMVGPMQPVSFADDALLESDSASDQLLLDESFDADEAIEEEVPEPGELTVEQDPVEVVEENPASIDEPEENANSPPAGDDSDIEQASEDVETSMVVVPNAVDPDPGTCGGIGQEPCPGGGDDQPAKAMVALQVYGKLDLPDGLVVGLPDVAIEIFDGNGRLLGDNVTNANGAAQVELSVGSTYTFKFSKSGFVTQDGVTLTVSATSNQLIIHLQRPTLTMTITVVDAATNVPVSGATVKILNSTGSVTEQEGPTDANGVMIASGLEYKNYRAGIIAGGYHQQEIQFSMRADSAITVNLEVNDFFGAKRITVIDSATGSPLPNADITLFGPGAQGVVDTGKTSEAGQWTSTSLNANRTYAATVSLRGYHTQEDIQITITGGQTTDMTIELQPALKVLKIQVVDDVTGDPLPGMNVRVAASVDTEVVYRGVTDENGQWESQPLQEQGYSISISGFRYDPMNGGISSIPSGFVEVKLKPFSPGTFTINVNDAVTGHPLKDAVVTVSDRDQNDVVVQGNTNENGQWVSEQLQGDYYYVEVSAEGYSTRATNPTLRGNAEISFSLYSLDYPANIRFYVVEADTWDAIPQAKITVRGEGVDMAFLTNEYGESERIDLAPGTYEFVIEAAGYKVYRYEDTLQTRVQYGPYIEMEPDSTVTLEVMIQAPVPVAANLMASSPSFTPTMNQASAQLHPVANAHVQLLATDSNDVVAEGKSDSQGLVVLPGVEQGTYQLTVSVPGFEPYAEPIELTENANQVITLQPITSTTPGDGDDTDNPGTGDPGDNTNPGNGDTDNPGTGEPGDVTNPGSGGTNTGVTSGGSGTGSSGGNTTNAVAQSAGGTNSVTSDLAREDSVSRLPNTGTGTSQSHSTLLVVTVLAGAALLSAGIRRTSR